MALHLCGASCSSVVLGFWKWFWWEVLVSFIYLPFGQGKAAGWKTAGAQVFAAN